ncbi:MAG: phosphate starvation-inducible protein PhoH [Bacillus sp. (in: firmicutes)]
MKKDFLVLNPGGIFAQTRANDPNYKADFDHIDIYSLPDVNLNDYKCLVITGFADQEFLYEERDIIRQFLDSKKVVVFSGNLVTDWLPGGKNFIAKEIKSFKDYEVSIAKPHPIFEGVIEDDMTYNKGVSGFFARGHHPLPEGAEVLLTLPGDEPITYIDRQSTKGTIIVHVGFDLFGYMQSEPKKTTDRIGKQLIQFVRDEFDRLQGGEKQ